MTNRQKAANLSLSQRWWVAKILVLFPLAGLGLRTLGFKRCYLVLGRLSALLAFKPQAAGKTLARAKYITDLVALAKRRYSVYEAPCLPESLTLWWLLRCEGIKADLRLGVRTITGPFESHAWIEYNGIVLNDSKNVGRIYEPFDLSGLTDREKLS